MMRDFRNDVMDCLVKDYGWVNFGTSGEEITKLIHDSFRYSVVKNEDDGKSLDIFTSTGFYVADVDCSNYSSQAVALQIMSAIYEYA